MNIKETNAQCLIVNRQTIYKRQLSFLTGRGLTIEHCALVGLMFVCNFKYVVPDSYACVIITPTMPTSYEQILVPEDENLFPERG